MFHCDPVSLTKKAANSEEVLTADKCQFFIILIEVTFYHKNRE